MAVASMVLLILFRGLMRRVLAAMHRRGLGTTRAVVVGLGSGADMLHFTNGGDAPGQVA